MMRRLQEMLLVSSVIGHVAVIIAVFTISSTYAANKDFSNRSSKFLENEFSPSSGGRKQGFPVPKSLQAATYNRTSKLFPLFTLIRFANEICRTTNEETGVCYTRTQCNALGGIAQGNCASGLGVCCRFIATCGAIVYQNGTSFQNPNYPTKYVPAGGSDVCQVRVRKQHNVCQLRLNFIAFDLDNPHTGTATTGGGGGAGQVVNDAGVCKVDSLAITSSGATVPSLCGNMNGQHLYVDFGSSDTITLNLLLGGATQRERTWNIEILTIPCNSQTRAPSGCLQYFTGVSGQLESFNNQGGGGMHLANLDYSVCVRMEDGMRFIDWTPCNQNAIRLGGTAPPTTIPTTPQACPAMLQDYLIIPQGISFPLTASSNTATGPPSASDRFCDASFYVAGSYIRTSAKPFFMHVRTDMMEGGSNDLTSGGYCFRWQQNPQ